MKVFIDGSAGTTGLRIYERLSARRDIDLLILPERKRKDPDARQRMLNLADVAFRLLAAVDNHTETAIDNLTPAYTATVVD